MKSRDFGPTIVIAPDVIFVGGEVQIGPGCILGIHGEKSAEPLTLGSGVVLEPGVIVARGVHVGDNSLLCAGAVVTSHVPPGAVVSGNPAKIVKSFESTTRHHRLSQELNQLPDRCRFLDVDFVNDLRGELNILDFAYLPIQPKRVFVVSTSGPQIYRGVHAHRTCTQMLVPLAGSLTCVLSDGTTTVEVRLNSSRRALLIGPMVWGTQYDFTDSAHLLVLADRPYSREDYIEDYEIFLAELARYDA